MKKKFIGKTDSNFTIEESKIILSHLLKEYSENKNKNMIMTFDEMVFAVANDFGLTPKQIRDSFMQPSLIKIIDELELNQNKVVQGRKEFVENITDELNKPYAFKRDYYFTAQESSDIWNYTSKEYLAKEKYSMVKFNAIMQAVGTDLGLNSKQVRLAISQPNRDLIQQLAKKHDKVVKAKNKAIRIVTTLNYPKIIKTLYLTDFWTWILKQRKTK